METEILEKKRKKTVAPQRMSLAKFVHWKSLQEDQYKYEWNNGIVEKNEIRTKHSEWFIMKNINRAFAQTEAYQLGGGITTNPDVRINEEKLRIPDMAFLTKEQIQIGANQADEVAFDQALIPSFAIEIISPNDKVYHVKRKLLEYFNAGVLAVWYIYPPINEVDVYVSPKDITICTDQDTCTAAPALDDFAMTVQDIFAK